MAQYPGYYPPMGSYSVQPTYHHPSPPAHKDLEVGDVDLVIVQQPKDSLVAQSGKEKSRKPLDPPPVVELRVNTDADPNQHFHHSPYLFLVATLWDEDCKEVIESPFGSNSPVLAGNHSSSLYKLKHPDGHEGGYFIFGDMSVRLMNKFRLKFTLYDLRLGCAIWLAETISDSFTVTSQKDFKGMEESTALSKSFAEQGVRLRLRKEPRGYSSKSRQFPVQEPEAQKSPTEQTEGSNEELQTHVNSFDAAPDHFAPVIDTTDDYRTVLPYPGDPIYYNG